MNKNLNDLLQHIDSLKNQLDSVRPLISEFILLISGYVHDSQEKLVHLLGVSS